MGTFSPALGRGGVNWQRQGADAWRLSTWHHIKYSEVSYRADPTTLAEAIIHITGRGRMFCGRATDFREGDALVMEVIVAGNVGAFLAMMAKLYRTAGYHGQVDVGVAVTNVHGAGSLRMQRGFQTSAYNAPGFTRTARFAVAELGDHERRTLDLLGRVFAASTGLDGYDPFEERR